MSENFYTQIISSLWCKKSLKYLYPESVKWKINTNLKIFFKKYILKTWYRIDIFQQKVAKKGKKNRRVSLFIFSTWKVFILKKIFLTPWSYFFFVYSVMEKGQTKSFTKNIWLVKLIEVISNQVGSLFHAFCAEFQIKYHWSDIYRKVLRDMDNLNNLGLGFLWNFFFFYPSLMVLVYIQVWLLIKAWLCQRELSLLHQFKVLCIFCSMLANWTTKKINYLKRIIKDQNCWIVNF